VVILQFTVKKLIELYNTSYVKLMS